MHLCRFILQLELSLLRMDPLATFCGQRQASFSHAAPLIHRSPDCAYQIVSNIVHTK